MAHNFHSNAYNDHQHRQPGGVAAYSMGMAPMPPPSSQDVAVAMANHLLDHQADQDMNVDSRLRTQNAPAPHMGRINVRVPINGRTTRDIEFDADIPRADFVSRVCAAMGVPVATAELGWKFNDDPLRAPAQQLTTDEELCDAFRSLLKLKHSTRRKKEVTMLIFHLNPRPAEFLKKTNENRSPDFTYADELRLVREKLKCEQHNGPNRWCYASPGNPNEHVALGLEEVALWARKLKDDPTLDRECITPPNVLSLDKLRDRANCSSRSSIKSTPSAAPVHVHINNTPFTGTSINSSQYSSSHLKRTFSAVSSSSEDGTDAESLLLSDILADLHTKFPMLNLPQYKSVLADHGIVYASSVHDFSREYFIDLGMSEGAVGPFVKGVARTLRREKKRAKLGDKENYVIRARDESVSL